MKNSFNKYANTAKAGFLSFGCLLASGCTDQNTQSAALKSTKQVEASGISDEKISQYLLALVDNHILPNYQQLNNSVEQFNVNIDNVCSSRAPTTTDWQLFQSNWRDVMTIWQQIKWLKLGPVAELNIHSQIQYWPDANGAVKRGVSKLLLSAQTPNLEALSNQNVGAQGLPALEHILFSKELVSQFDGIKRCESLQVIAANMKQMTTAILNTWQVEDSGYAAEFVSGRGEFTSVKDTLEELTSNWLAQLILIVDNKLTYPLSIAAPGVALLAESPIADSSGENIVQNLLSFRAIFTAQEDSGQIGFDGMLNEQTGNNELSQRILANIDESIVLAKSISSSFTDNLASEQGRTATNALIESLRTLQILLAVDMLDALTLNTGFNALDGD